jgi:hypothetical protein
VVEVRKDLVADDPVEPLTAVPVLLEGDMAHADVWSIDQPCASLQPSEG